MAETAIVPYRVSTLARVESIDLSLIPDCGREEILRVKRGIQERHDAFEGLVHAQFIKTFRSYLHYSGSLLALIIIVCIVRGIMSAGDAVGLTIIGSMGAFMFSLAVATHKRDEDNLENAPVLRDEIKKLETRLQGLKSREELTGLISQADRLLHEAEVFNQKLFQLGDVVCSERECGLVMEGRHKLMERILHFREEVEGKPEASSPAQLMESSAT